MSSSDGASPPALQQNGCACGNCGTVFCGAQNNGYLSGVSLTHLIGITVLVISIAAFLGCARACFLNLRFRHLAARNASRAQGRDAEAGVNSTPVPVAEPRAQPPQKPQPLRVVVINPDEEVMCGVELMARDVGAEKGLAGEGKADPQQDSSGRASSGGAVLRPAGNAGDAAEQASAQGAGSGAATLAQPPVAGGSHADSTHSASSGPSRGPGV